MNSTVTADTVLQRFKVLHSIIRKKLNNKTEVVFVSIKPSVSRWHLEKTFNESNALIKVFLSKEKNTTFLDVHTSMLTSDSDVMKDIFLGDNLHMNAKGYSLWTTIIQPIWWNDLDYLKGIYKLPAWNPFVLLHLNLLNCGFHF